MAERIDVYAQSLLHIAEAEGRVGEVEDELFRFARIVDANDELRMALSDRQLPAERRVAIVDELLEQRALPTTVAIISFIVAAGRGHDLTGIVQRFVELAAELRTEVASLSVELAGRIVEKNLDPATQMQLVDSFIDQVGRSN